MGRTIQTCRIAKMKPFKSTNWRKITKSIKRGMSSPPPASPFNSTASLIRQRSQLQKEAVLPPVFGAPELDQYGSNSKDVIACCTFATSHHEQGCSYKSQADHPVIIGLSPQSLARNLAKLQVADPPQPEGNVKHDQHHSRNHGASSAGTRRLEDPASAVHEKGLEMVKHRRIRSFEDGNFDILLSNAASLSAETLDEIVDEDLRNNFCALEM